MLLESECATTKEYLIHLYETYVRDEDRENRTLMGLWFDQVHNPETVFCTKERLR